MSVIYAPHQYILEPRPWVFLSGSIDMGAATDWQAKASGTLNGCATVLNPRRPDWDSTWLQSKLDGRFQEQVLWELRALRAADLVLVYLAPGSQAPISLMELGLVVGQERSVVVCCPDEYHRQGNVELLCQHYAVPFFQKLEHALDCVIGLLAN